jgi:hemoglobin
MTDTFYVRLGGEAGVRAVVDRFYDLMDTLPEARAIRAMHPTSLSESRQKLFEFLSGWLGGPNLYIEKRGHPRLRARHMPFPVDAAARDAWMLCMTRAMTELVTDDDARQKLLKGLADLADHMRNQPA